MNTSDLAGDSAGTRFQEARQELEMATSGKHDLSFDFTEPEAYRRDVPDDEFFGSIVRSATGGAEQFARLAVLARRAKALCRVDRYREKPPLPQARAELAQVLARAELVQSIGRSPGK